MSNYKNIKNKGFDKNPQNINRKGRPLSIKQDLKTILEIDGKFTIDAKNIVSINDDGSVTIKIPTSESLALKLLQLATNGKNSNTLKAIQMIMEQIDGKPKQSIDIQETRPIQILQNDPLSD